MIVRFYQLKPVYVDNPILSWAIRLVEWENGRPLGYSHIGATFGEEGAFDVTGAYGASFTTREDLLSRYYPYEILEFKVDASFEEVFNWFLKHSRKDYSESQNFGFLLKIARIFKDNVFGHDERKLVCSELLVLFIRDWVGVDIGDSDQYDLKDAWAIGERYAS